MEKSKFKQGVTFKVFPSHKVNADKRATIYLRATIERKKKEFNLNVQWPPEHFSDERHEAMPRFAKDPEVAGVNMIIKEAKGRADRIALIYFTNGRTLTLEQFEKEFINYACRENYFCFLFITFLTACTEAVPACFVR